MVLTAEISLTGAGRSATTIQGALDSVDGLLRLQGDGIALRSLTVVNDLNAAGSAAVAVTVAADLVPSSNWILEDLTAIGREGDSATNGIRFRETACGGGRMTNVIAVGNSGSNENHGAVFACSSGESAGENVTFRGEFFDAIGLEKLNASSLRLHGSSFTGITFTGTPNSIIQSGGTLKVIGSELDGPVSGGVVCVNAFDETGAVLSNGINGSGGCI